MKRFYTALCMLCFIGASPTVKASVPAAQAVLTKIGTFLVNSPLAQGTILTAGVFGFMSFSEKPQVKEILEFLLKPVFDNPRANNAGNKMPDSVVKNSSTVKTEAINWYTKVSNFVVQNPKTVAAGGLALVGAISYGMYAYRCKQKQEELA